MSIEGRKCYLMNHKYRPNLVKLPVKSLITPKVVKTNFYDVLVSADFLPPVGTGGV